MNKTFHEIELEAWAQRASTYDTLFAAISTQAIDGILNSLGPLDGRHHLDVACGTGHLVAAAFKRGACSEGIDFAQPMIDLARLAYPQASFQVADAAELPHANHCMDAVTCAFGLSHMETPEAAVAEAFRVLKAGGIFAFTLWFGPEEGNDFQKMVQDTLAALATIPFEIPERWTQLRVADRQACLRITSQAGFGKPGFQELPIVWQTNSAQDVLAFLDKLSVRTKMVIDHQQPAIQQRIRELILSKVEARRTNGGILMAWPALLTVVQKPPGR